MLLLWGRGLLLLLLWCTGLLLLLLLLWGRGLLVLVLCCGCTSRIGCSLLPACLMLLLALNSHALSQTCMNLLRLQRRHLAPSDDELHLGQWDLGQLLLRPLHCDLCGTGSLRACCCSSCCCCCISCCWLGSCSRSGWCLTTCCSGPTPVLPGSCSLLSLLCFVLCLGFPVTLLAGCILSTSPFSSCCQQGVWQGVWWWCGLHALHKLLLQSGECLCSCCRP